MSQSQSCTAKASKAKGPRHEINNRYSQLVLGHADLGAVLGGDNSRASEYVQLVFH